MAGTPEPKFVIRRRRTMPSELRWEKKADELEYTTLDRVRSVAEKWAASLAAVLGLGSTILIVKGREDISKLDTPYQWAVAILLLVALVVAVIATYLAARAAQGTPQDVKWPNGAKLRKWEHDQALSARADLKTSRWLTIVTVMFLVLAVGLTWFGEAKPSSATPASVLVVRTAGAPLCGTLIPGGEPGSVSLEQSEGQVIALDPKSLRSVVAVSTCPGEKNE